MAMPDFIDHAQPILSATNEINKPTKANLYDVFHTSKDPQELAQHLGPLPISNGLKTQLFEAKQKTVPPPEPLDKATRALSRIAQLDPKILDLAEAHPKVTTALINAATKDNPEATAPAAPAAEKEPKEEKKEPLKLSPRADGQPHMPPIPEGHHRVLASDGSVHDVPAENIEQARGIDPGLHVLNP